MKTADFIREHNACREGAKWALSVSSDMAEVWDALVDQGMHEWLFWTATRPGVFPDSVLRKLACRFVRETPLADGRTVWDLLEDDRSRRAIEVAEAYVDGNATEKELVDAHSAARAAADPSSYTYATAAFSAAWAAESAAYSANAADAAADAAAWAAADARAAADAAAWDAADAAADAAQVRMIVELGNPFKKGSSK